MTLLSPARAPALAAALEAIARREPNAGEALVAAVAADEDVAYPTSDDGRHPLTTGPAGSEHLTAFSGAGLALWAHPDRPPLDLRPIGEVLGWVPATGRSLRLDHASEADVVLGPAEAEALLSGRAPDPDAIRAGDEFRNPGPPAPAPTEALPRPAPTTADTDADTVITHGRRWDEEARELVDPVTRDDLDAVPDLVGGYTTVRRRGEAVDAVTFGDTVVAATSYGRNLVRRWVWARFTEGLFLTEHSVADDDGTARPHARLVVLSRPDGLIRTWTARPDGSDMVTSSSPDMSDRWIGTPEVGVIGSLVDDET